MIIHVNKKKPRQVENQTDAFLISSEQRFFNEKVTVKNRKQMVKCCKCGKEIELNKCQLFKSRPESEHIGRHRIRLTRHIEAYCKGKCEEDRINELDGIQMEGCTDNDAVQMRKEMREINEPGQE